MNMKTVQTDKYNKIYKSMNYINVFETESAFNTAKESLPKP